MNNKCKMCELNWTHQCKGKDLACNQYIKHELRRKPTIIHSLWMKPMLGNKHKMEVTLFCFATSVAYLRKFNRKCVLYCDDTARNFLSILPYDEFLPLSPIDDTKTGMWAQCKFDALSKMELGDVHIDGDVFLRSSRIFEIIDKLDYDVIVQSRECPIGKAVDPYEQMAMDAYNGARKYLQDVNFQPINGCHVNEDYSWNVGVIGVNNQNLKDIYLQTYLDAVAKISTEGMGKDIIPDLVIEQQFLYQLTERFQYKVRNLLGSNRQEVQATARALKYMHVLSINKLQQLPEIKVELFQVDRNLCKKVIQYARELGILSATTNIEHQLNNLV